MLFGFTTFTERRLVFLLLMQMTLGQAQSWQGQMGTRRLLVTLQSDSLLLLQIPEAGVRNLPIKLLAFGNDTLAFDAGNWGLFTGRKTRKKETIDGKLTRNGTTRPMQLTEVDSLQPLRLAQAPQPPFPYRSENVTFYNADSSIRFGGTLTLPAAKRRHTAVILVSGTGPQNRDAVMAGHPWFAVLADQLIRAGYAVLRTDDRGVGQTTGMYADATTADFSADALAAVRYLQSRKEINPAKIGMLGHSEGGAAITIAAAADNRIAFLISLSGLATPGLQALKAQNERLIDASSQVAAEKAAQKELYNMLFDSVHYYAGDSAAVARSVSKGYEQWKMKNDSISQQPGMNNYLSHFRFFKDAYVRQATGKWYSYHVRYDPAAFLPKVRVPILAIGSDADVMVPAAANLATIRKWAGSKNVTTVVLPSLNHLLQHCTRCTAEESVEIDETIAPEVVKKVVGWLKRNDF